MGFSWVVGVAVLRYHDAVVDVDGVPPLGIQPLQDGREDTSASVRRNSTRSTIASTSDKKRVTKKSN